MSTPVKVMIVDDHAIVREGLTMLLGEEADIDVVGEARNGVDALTRIAGRLRHAGDRSEVDQKASSLLALAK